MIHDRNPHFDDLVEPKAINRPKLNKEDYAHNNYLETYKSMKQYK